MMNQKLVAVMMLAAFAALGPLQAEEPADAPTATPAATVQRPEATERRAYADQLRLEATSIRGNQELPRVMYIVPWKDSSLGDVAGKPVNSLIEEVLAPVDRDVFLRQTKYFDQLYGSAGEGSPEASE